MKKANKGCNRDTLIERKKRKGSECVIVRLSLNIDSVFVNEVGATE